jgi:hypothetical protein
MYNVDETDNITVHTPHKAVVSKDFKQVGSDTSGERCSNATSIACINALSNCIPLMFIFLRVYFNERMLKGGPNGCLGMAKVSGYSDTLVLVESLKFFPAHQAINNEVILSF